MQSVYPGCGQRDVTCGGSGLLGCVSPISLAQTQMTLSHFLLFSVPLQQ